MRTSGASCNVDNVGCLRIEAAGEGDQPAQLFSCVSRGRVKIPLQTGDVGVRIRPVEQRKKQGPLRVVHGVHGGHRPVALIYPRSVARSRPASADGTAKSTYNGVKCDLRSPLSSCREEELFADKPSK